MLRVTGQWELTARRVFLPVFPFSFDALYEAVHIKCFFFVIYAIEQNALNIFGCFILLGVCAQSNTLNAREHVSKRLAAVDTFLRTVSGWVRIPWTPAGCVLSPAEPSKYFALKDAYLSMPSSPQVCTSPSVKWQELSPTDQKNNKITVIGQANEYAVEKLD